MEAVGGGLKIGSDVGEDIDSVDGDGLSRGGHWDGISIEAFPRDDERNRELTGKKSFSVAAVK